MSQLIEREQEGDRQEGRSRITVFDTMPEDSGEESIAPKQPESGSNTVNIGRRDFLKGLVAVAGAVALSHTVARGVEAAVIKVGNEAKRVKEALTAQEAFINLTVKDPVKTIVNAPFFEVTTDSQGNLNSIRVLGNQSETSYPKGGWHSLKSINLGGVFSKYDDELGPFSIINDERASTVHIVEANGKPTKAYISYEGGVKALTLKEGGGLGAAEVEEIVVPGMIFSKVAYPEKNKVVYSPMRVESVEDLLFIDTRTNLDTPIPVSIGGATLDPFIQKGRDGNIYCSALSSSSRNPYGYLKIVPDLENLTITGERRHADVRSDNFYLDQSGSEEKALLHDGNRYVLRIFNETTNKLERSYKTDGLLNHIEGLGLKDSTDIASIASIEGRIYAGVSVSMQKGLTPFLVSWPDNIDPNANPDMVTYVDLAEGIFAPKWEGVFIQRIEVTKRNGRNLILMYIFYKGLVAVEAEADGSLSKDTLKLMLAEGVLKAEATPTPVPPEETSTSTPTPTITNTPTPLSTPQEQIKKIFLPVVNKFQSITGW